MVEQYGGLEVHKRRLPRLGGLVLYQWGPGTNKARQQYTDGQIQH